MGNIKKCSSRQKQWIIQERWIFEVDTKKVSQKHEK